MTRLGLANCGGGGARSWGGFEAMVGWVIESTWRLRPTRPDPDHARCSSTERLNPAIPSPCPSAIGLVLCPCFSGWALNSRECFFSVLSLSLSRHPTSSQLLENFRRQSVEGLALPFLANWLLGTIYIPLDVHRNTHLRCSRRYD